MSEKVFVFRNSSVPNCLIIVVESCGFEVTQAWNRKFMERSTRVVNGKLGIAKLLYYNSCLPTHVPDFAPHLSPTLLIIASHPFTSYIFPVPGKRKGRNDNVNVVWWMVLIRTALLSWVPLNLCHEFWVSRLAACLGADGASPWEGEGGVGDGWWLNRSVLPLAGKQECRSSREGQIRSEIAKCGWWTG